MEKITTAEYFNCPKCGKDLGEENLMQLMGEPFNGDIIECECGTEISCNILIKMQVID